MFRIHIIIITFMVSCGIGFFLWGNISCYKTKYQTSLSIAETSERKSKHEKSDKVKSKAITIHANVTKEEANVSNTFEEYISTRTFSFSREAVKIALLFGKNLPISITDWQSVSGGMSTNFGANMAFGIGNNSSYSEPSSYRKRFSNLESPISDFTSGTLSISLTEISTETKTESRISGSAGRRNPPKVNTGLSRTSGTGSSVSRSSSVSDDHGDSASSATRMKIGDEVSGGINPEGDRDYFAFDGKARDVINIEITARMLGSDLDSYITLFGPDGSRLASNDDSGNSLDSRIGDFELPETGKYKVEVRAFGYGGGPGEFYSLTVVRP